MQKPSTEPSPHWTLAIVGASTFMSALDGSIINVSLPTIGHALNVPVSTLEWISLAYLITVSAALVPVGRLADLTGKRRIYMAGQALFALGSLACGVSPTAWLLIAARVLQGLGAAMLFALGPGLIVSAFPAHKRGQAMGLQASMTYLGLSIGPGLGGLLTQHFGWPSIFFVNVPIGLGLLLVSARRLPEDGREAPAPFDMPGAAAMAGALALALFALSKGPELGWGQPAIVAAAVLAVACLAFFLRHESRVEHPALDLTLFHSRVFAASVAAAFLSYLATAVMNFILPFYLIRGCGYSPSGAGAVLMAAPLAMLSVTALSGRLSDRIGPRIPTVAGMLLVAAGGLLLHGLGANPGKAALAACIALVGLGSGLFNAPNNSALMGAAPAHRRGVAGAVMAAARNLGFACGVALAGLVLTLHLHHAAAESHPQALYASLGWCVALMAVLALAAAGMSLVRGRHQPAAR